MFNAAVQNRFTAGVVSATTPMEICFPYRCAVSQQKCTQHCFWQNATPHVQCSCAKQVHSRLFQCNYTCGDVLFIQVCSDTAPVHCNTVSGTMQSPMFSAALQDRLTAGLCQCNYTYGNLLSIQVCSEPTEMHCNTVSAHMQCNSVQSKMQSPLFSAALQKRLTAGSVSVQLHLWRCALHTGVQ